MTIRPSDDDIRRATGLFAKSAAMWALAGKPPPPGPSIINILVIAQAIADARAHTEPPLDLTAVEEERAALVIEYLERVP